MVDGADGRLLPEVCAPSYRMGRIFRASETLGFVARSVQDVCVATQDLDHIIPDVAACAERYGELMWWIGDWASPRGAPALVCCKDYCACMIGTRIDSLIAGLLLHICSSYSILLGSVGVGSTYSSASVLRSNISIGILGSVWVPLP